MGAYAPFSYATLGTASTELAVRLNDPSSTFWTDAERALYIGEALQFFNCLTQYWAADYAVTLTPPFSSNWFSANVSGSPRQQSATDTSIYTLIEYHLLEPATGGTWTGTSQFSISDLQQAVQRRRDEVLQLSACNMAEIAQVITPNTNRVILPDNVLDVRRVRYVPPAGLGNPITLQRGDLKSFQRFSPYFMQSQPWPMRWDVLGSPPLSLTLDALVPVGGTLQILCMKAGNTLAPPATSALQVPNDWAWVVKFGALADILSKESEGKDEGRASYARKRYEEGLKLMTSMPWLLEAYINEVASDAPPVAQADRYNYEWQSNTAAFPGVVVGGIDTFAVAPIPVSSTGLKLVVVGNAPIPANDSADIQVPRDVLDAILDEAQHLAMLKRGGGAFDRTMPLHDSFIQACLHMSERLRMSGIFATDLRPPVSRQDEQQPRLALAQGQTGA